MNLVTEYINQGEKIKQKFPEIWHYESVLEDLKKLINNANISDLMVKNEFYKMEISTYNDFPSFIKAKDISTISYKFPTVIKKKVNKLFSHWTAGRL